MTKYYKVIKENFLWEVGAILTNSVDRDEKEKKGYKPIEDVWNKLSGDDVDTWLFPETVEKCPEYFERVYKLEDKENKFVTKKEVKERYEVDAKE